MKKEILIFLGAGASAPMGIPTMREFVREFEEHTKSDKISGGWNELRPILYKIEKIRKEVGHKPYDLEDLLRVIRETKDIDNNMAIALLRRISTRDGSNNRKKLDNRISYIHTKATQIELRLLEFIKQRCSMFNQRDAKKIYSPILNLRKKYNLKIFTTNYDTVLEQVCTSLKINYHDGFKLDKQQGDYYWSPQDLGRGNVSILKLHGSINWYNIKNKIIKSDLPLDKERVKSAIIYPTESKQIFNQPFKAIHRKFEEIIFNSDKCIVIGHTFRDDYIKNVFLERLSKGNFSVKLISGRTSKSIKKNALMNNKQVHYISKNFESSNINEMFGNGLSN